MKKAPLQRKRKANSEKHLVTEIQQQKKRNRRYSIFLDDEFAFGLDKEVLYVFPLHRGDELTRRQIDAILKEEEAVQARIKAVSLISYRARSVTELRQKLTVKGFGSDTVERVVQDLLRIGVLDDRKFAEAFVHTRMSGKPMAVRLLRQELRSKGLDPHVIEEVLENEYGPLSEDEVARSLAEKKKRSLPPDREKAARRLRDYLQRRGFGWQIIAPIIEEYRQRDE